MNAINVVKKSIVVLLVAISGNLSAAKNMAVVDLYGILQTSPQGQLIEQKIMEEFKDKQDKLIALRDSAQKLQEKIQREQATLTLTQTQEMTRKLEDQKREFQVEFKRLQQDMNQRKQQEEMAYRAKVQKIIQEVAKAEKVDLVFEKAALHFNSPDVKDITEKVKAKIK